jgi:hypothetical protein
MTRRAFVGRVAAVATAAAGIYTVGCGNDDKPSPSSQTTGPTEPVPTPTSEINAAAAEWRRLEVTGDGPAPRRDHSFTFNADDGFYYVFGGRAGGTALADLWVLDAGAPSWRRAHAVGSAPEPRFGHNAFYDAQGRRLVVALGQGARSFFNDVWAYAEGAWTRLDDGSAGNPQTRYGSGSAYDAQGNRLLISHGFTDSGRFDDTWAFDLGARVWARVPVAGPLPIKRCLTRSAWLSSTQRFLMFAGQTDSEPFLGDFWWLDVAGGAWLEQRPDVRPGARNLYAAAMDDRRGRWIVTTGNTPDGPVNDAWAYDVAAATWTRIAPAGELPPARSGADAAVAGDALHLFGGNDGQTDLADVWSLSLA